MSINPRTDTQIVVILLSHENEWPAATCNDMQNVQQKKPESRVHTAGFHLHEIQKQPTLIYDVRSQDQGSPGGDG